MEPREVHVVFGAGQVGSHLSESLLRSGAKVRVAKRSPAGIPEGAERAARVRAVEADPERTPLSRTSQIDDEGVRCEEDGGPRTSRRESHVGIFLASILDEAVERLRDRRNQKESGQKDDEDGVSTHRHDLHGIARTRLESNRQPISECNIIIPQLSVLPT